MAEIAEVVFQDLRARCGARLKSITKSRASHLIPMVMQAPEVLVIYLTLQISIM